MILEGSAVTEKIYQNIREKKVSATLAVILVGEDPASLSFVKAKEKIAEGLGFNFKLYHLPAIARYEQVKELIEALNKNKYIHGIVVQLPLPKEFNMEEVLKKIDPRKDIDGFSGVFPAPVALAILEILNFYEVELKNKKIVIVGHGKLVGEPLEKVLIKKGYQPIVLGSRDNLDSMRDADILISATGVAGLIKAEMVSEKTVVIDAGTSEIGGHLTGDVDRKVYSKVAAYTPVPGGVGPVTVAMLMKNLVEAAQKVC